MAQEESFDEDFSEFDDIEINETDSDDDFFVEDESFDSENLDNQIASEGSEDEEFFGENEEFNFEESQEDELALDSNLDDNTLVEEDFSVIEEPQETLTEMDSYSESDLQVKPPTVSPVKSMAKSTFDDAPDLQFEAELHDIYLRYHSTPMSDKDWDFIAGAKISEVYTIQRGDNLWDLSKTFFGDGNYWPKIWSVNSKITNPHLIEPKNVIRFILGNENEAPMFTITEEKGSSADSEKIVIAEEESLDVAVEDVRLEDLTKGVEELESELATEFSEAALEEELLSDEELEGVVIPPPEIIIRPVTQSFPPSLPEWKSHAESILKSREVDFKSSFKQPKKTRLALSHYIDENQPEGVAKVVGVEGGGHVAAQFQYIYLRAKKGWIKEGDKLLIVNNNGALVTKSKIQEDAIIWEVQGQVLVEYEVEATKKYKSDHFVVHRAYVESALTAIYLGAEALKSDYIFIDDSKKGRIPAVSGLIIGGAHGNKRNLLSKDSVAYMNIGTNEGVALGDILPIYANNYIEEFDPYVITTKKPMGLIKVVKVSEFYSTGFVLENNGSINIGDFVGVKEGFEKQFLGKKAYAKKKKEETDKEIEEIQSLLNEIEEDLDPGSTETFEYME